MPEPDARYEVVVSERATRQLVEHAAFAARLEERLGHRLVADFRAAAGSLRHFPYRNPVLRAEPFPTEKYRKLVFGGRYLLIYQIRGERVYVEYVVDGRQDYQWLIQ